MPEPRETHTAIDARRNAQRGGGERQDECRRCGHRRWNHEDGRCTGMHVGDIGRSRCECREFVEKPRPLGAIDRLLAERDALAATVQRVRDLAEQGYVSRDPRGPFAGFLHDLRAALDAAPSDPATDTGGEAT